MKKLFAILSLLVVFAACDQTKTEPITEPVDVTFSVDNLFNMSTVPFARTAEAATAVYVVVTPADGEAFSKSFNVYSDTESLTLQMHPGQHNIVIVSKLVMSVGQRYISYDNIFIPEAVFYTQSSITVTADNTEFDFTLDRLTSGIQIKPKEGTVKPDNLYEVLWTLSGIQQYWDTHTLQWKQSNLREGLTHRNIFEAGDAYIAHTFPADNIVLTLEFRDSNGNVLFNGAIELNELNNYLESGKLLVIEYDPAILTSDQPESGLRIGFAEDWETGATIVIQ